MEDVLQEIEAQEEGGSGDIPTSTGAAEHVDGIDREMLEDGELDEEDDTSIPRDHSTEKEAPVSVALISHRRMADQSAGGVVYSGPASPAKRRGECWRISTAGTDHAECSTWKGYEHGDYTKAQSAL